MTNCQPLEVDTHWEGCGPPESQRNCIGRIQPEPYPESTRDSQHELQTAAEQAGKGEEYKRGGEQEEEGSEEEDPHDELLQHQAVCGRQTLLGREGTVWWTSKGCSVTFRIYFF